MIRLRDILVLAVLSAAFSLLFCAAVETICIGRAIEQAADAGAATFRSVPSAIAREGDRTREVVNSQATALRSDLFGNLKLSEDRLFSEVAATRALADSQLNGIRADVSSQLTRTNDSIAGVRSDLQPVLASATKTADDSDHAVQILTKPTLQTVTGAKLTLGEFAQTAREIRKATPEVSASVVSIGKSADGIASDARREADELTKPKKWWQKALGPVYTVTRCVAIFL